MATKKSGNGSKKCLDVVLYTDLKYKRIDLDNGLSILVYLGVINEDNLPRVLPYPKKDEGKQITHDKLIVNLDEEEVEVKFELDETYLKGLDPKLWKDQDHYRKFSFNFSINNFFNWQL